MDSVQVTNAVTIGVEEGDGIYLVNGSFFPPRPRWNKGRWHRGEECEKGSTWCVDVARLSWDQLWEIDR